MTNFASNYTPRLKVKYSLAGREHTVSLRPNVAIAPVDTVDSIHSILSEFQPYMTNDFAFISAEYAAQGQDFFLPITTSLFTTSPIQGVNTDAVLKRQAGEAFISLTGKTVLGNPWRFFIYGVTVAGGSSVADDNYRVLPAENAAVPGILALVNDLADSIIFTGIDRQRVIVNQYLNVGVSAYYQRKARKGL